MSEKIELTITEEEGQAIKLGNLTARNIFFFKNYEALKKIVHHYLFQCSNYLESYDIEEYLNQIYIDLPYLNYSSKTYFNYLLYHEILPRVKRGGYSYIYETNSKLLSQNYPMIEAQSLYYEHDDGDVELITDILGMSSGDDPQNEFVCDKHELRANKIMSFCSRYLTQRESEVLQLYLDGYSYLQIEDKGYKCVGPSMLQIRKKLIEHFFELKKYMYDELGFSISRIYDPIVDDMRLKIQLEKEKKRLKQREQYRNKIAVPGYREKMNEAARLRMKKRYDERKRI